MTLFEMIKYHSQAYPTNIPLRIEEVAAHFDIAKIQASMRCSLHTEYSYGKRMLNNAIITNFPALVSAQKDGIPQLWKNVQWAEEFANFIFCLVGNRGAPRVIEIHPPFSDYTDMRGFIEAYSIFEQMIISAYPNVDILIENRCGSIYRGGKFIISRIEDMEELCGYIQSNDLKMRIACDIPQIYTAHKAQRTEEYIRLLERVSGLKAFIGGVHLWGKTKTSTGRRIAHCGDLNSYFEYDAAAKAAFLSEFAECFGDNAVRKMVLEVNSGAEDMRSILEDLLQAGVKFV